MSATKRRTGKTTDSNAGRISLDCQAFERLTRIDSWLESQLVALSPMMAHLEAMRCIPGNGGDISFLAPPELTRRIEKLVAQSTAIRVPFRSLSELATIRSDGRTYYRAEGMESKKWCAKRMSNIAGKLILATTSAAKLWTLASRFSHQMCIVRASEDLDGLEILYGPRQHGGVPTTEIVAHLLMHDANVSNGRSDSCVLHVHPQLTIDCSRAFARRPTALLKALYRQRPELIVNAPDLIGVTPLLLPGSSELTRWTARHAPAYRVILWSAHGIVVRESSLEKCVDLLDYVEASAGAVLLELSLKRRLQSIGRYEVEQMVQRFSLSPRVLSVF